MKGIETKGFILLQIVCLLLLFLSEVNGKRRCGRLLQNIKLPAHTRFATQQLKANHVTVMCDKGYHFFQGKNTVHLSCQILNFLASYQIRICKAINVCGTPQDDCSEFSACANTGPGTYTCTCKEGYTGDGKTCEAPCRIYGVQPFPGGYIKRNGFRHNEEIIFGCRDPFVIVGQDTLRCDNGDWQGQLPSCGEPCRNLAVPRNGEKIKDGYKHGDEVVFRCHPGFQMVGTSNRLCSFGIWNDSRIPRCERKCPDPSKDTNARVVGDQFYNGMQVEFICSDDGVLEPEISKKLTCKNGRWDGIMPWCKASCPPLPQIRNGATFYPHNERRHGDLAVFFCNRGYQQRGSSIAECNNGVWSDKIPRCLVRSPSTSTTPTTNMITTIGQPKVCTNIAKLRKGRIKGTGVSPGSKRIFSCSKNWELSGSKEITCLDNGKWSGLRPKCKLGGPVINCTVVGKIKGGYAKKNESFHGGRVVFVCYPNYTMSTTKPGMLCRSGKWSQKPHPKCYAPCETPVAPQNGFISKISGRKHEDFIIFSCNENYTLSGSATLQCQDGTWSDPPPICQATN